MQDNTHKFAANRSRFGHAVPVILVPVHPSDCPAPPGSHGSNRRPNMFKKPLIAVLFMAATTPTAQADTKEPFLSQWDATGLTLAAVSGGKERIYNRPHASFKGQWFTTQDGCSYSRANPPGGQSVWYLILNPHHIGQPNAHSGCARTL